MTIRWYGLVAPEEAATGDRRMFGRDILTYRDFPLPAAWQRVSGPGHQGSVVVASWDHTYTGDGGVWGAGVFLDPGVVPEVTEAIYLMERRLVGPSVDLDPDFAYEVVAHPDRPDEYAMKVTRGNIHGVTFVMGPAFPQVHVTVDTEEEMTILASAGITMATFASSGVNSSSWSKFPLAPDRATTFDHDSAVDRIAAWSGGDAAKFGSAFLWKDPQGNALNRETYRLPIIDILDGKAYLIPRAVFSAGVIMSGGHGGLYDTLSEADRLKVQEVITDIYDFLRDTYADPRVVAPWQRGGRQGARNEADEPSRVASIEVEDMISEELDAYIDSRVQALLVPKFNVDATATAVGTVVTGDTLAENESLTAAGVLRPTSAWFGDPGFRRPTPLQITEDGRVFGHLATWKQCHMAVGNKCQLAPASRTNYGYFKTGSVLTAEGKTIRVGKITLGTGHADKMFGVRPAIEHYDNTGLGVAVVNAGEDSFGVWVAGALVDGVTETQAAELRRSPLSGDWRRVDGNLELVAALAVNSPGFTVLHEDGDGSYSLVAAGVLNLDGSGDQHEIPVPDDGPPVGDWSAVDSFLAGERAEAIGRAFHDLLPPQEGCGCNV